MFGALPIQLTTVRSAFLKNTSNNHAFFKVKRNFCTTYFHMRVHFCHGWRMFVSKKVEQCAVVMMT